MTRPADTYESIHERRYDRAEELVNVLSHGLAALLSGLALVLLVRVASRHGTALHVAAYAVFGASLVILYTMSTLYHGLSWTRARRVLETLDHAAIYLLIAGTYTAFCLTVLQGALGYTICAVNWVLAVLGIVLKTRFLGRFKRLSLAGYLAMGWLVIVAIRPLVAGLPALALALLVAGGLAYSLGTIFFMLKQVRFFHGIWHLFVVAGSTCHVLAALWAWE